MKNEVLEYLPVSSGKGLVVDATVGEGGHASSFLEKYPDITLAGVDADPEMIERSRQRLSAFGERVTLYNTFFDDFFVSYPADLAVPSVVLMDLGISTYHYTSSGAGFSFKSDEPLDMRLDPRSEISARDIVNTWQENDLADCIYKFGEERYSRRISRAVCERRRLGKISTSRQLADIVFSSVPKKYRHGRIHPATRTFQALRVAVNNELERLTEGLTAAVRCLAVHGRIGVISFHSLEDRIVKNIFRDMSKSCICPPNEPICKCRGKKILKRITRKVLTPKGEEVFENPASRSAKFRVAEKVNHTEVA